jgi:hypothetical protein
VQQQQAHLDQRAQHLQKLMEQAPEPLRREVLDMIELSWLYHENALEGVVYSPEELATAMRGGAPEDPVMASSFDEIRQNKATIDLIRSWAAEKRAKIDENVLKDIYASLAPDEVDGKKPPAYRKDIPLHRLYFHEIAAPDKILPKLKAFAQWINAPDTRRTTHVLRLAAKAHFHLLHIYPYPKHSGKVARLVMNLLLLAAGYPPAVIHSTERQRYYDALRTNENALAQIVKEALTASIESAIRLLEARLPPPAPPPVKKIKLVSRRRLSDRPAVTVANPAAPKLNAPASKPASDPQLKSGSVPPAKASTAPAKPAAKIATKTAPTKPTLTKPTLAKPTLAKPTLAKPTLAKPTLAKPTLERPKGLKAPKAKAKPSKAKPAAKVTRLAKGRKPASANRTAKAKPRAAKVLRAGKPRARRAA